MDMFREIVSSLFEYLNSHFAFVTELAEVEQGEACRMRPECFLQDLSSASMEHEVLAAKMKIIGVAGLGHAASTGSMALVYPTFAPHRRELRRLELIDGVNLSLNDLASTIQ